MSATTYARVCGVLYLLVTITGVFAVYGPSGIRVIGDPVATAHNLAAHELTWRLAIASDIVAGLLYVAVTMMLYRLTKPVDSPLATIAAMFSVCGIAIGMISEVFRLLPLLLDSTTQAPLMYASMRLFNEGYMICLAFFGVYCFLLGVLIYRSTFIPKLIGAFMMLGGICYCTDSFSTIIAPVATLSWPSFSIVSGVAELVLTLWLIAMGVNAAKWRALDGADHI